MLCHRCRGLMISDQPAEADIFDLPGEAGGSRVATRCINCGCVDDAVIRANRLLALVATRPDSL